MQRKKKELFLTYWRAKSTPTPSQYMECGDRWPLRESEHFSVWQGEKTKEEVKDIEESTNKGHNVHKAPCKCWEGVER